MQNCFTIIDASFIIHNFILMHEGQGADDEIDEGCGECVVQAFPIQVHQQTHDAATRKRNRIAAMLK